MYMGTEWQLDRWEGDQTDRQTDSETAATAATSETGI